MIRIGISLESSARVIGPSLSPFTPSAVPRATPSRITGNAHTTSMEREITESVTPPKKPARIPSSTDRSAGDQRRGDPDDQRVAPAVEQPHRGVAAVAVRAQEVLALVGRPDRHAVGRDHVLLLAVHGHGADLVVVLRAALGHVRRPRRARPGTWPRPRRTAPGTPARSCCGAAGGRRSATGPVPGWCRRGRTPPGARPRPARPSRARSRRRAGRPPWLLAPEDRNLRRARRGARRIPGVRYFRQNWVQSFL